MDKTRQQFGGDWTEEKLRALGKYLAAYTTIMAKQRFRFAYIDAFAGTGYREARDEDNPNELLLPELAADDTQAFVRGSARIALEVRPRFDKYIFVEKDPSRFSELERLRDEHDSLRDDIRLVNQDANPFLKKMCSQSGWDKRRAVLFLDPFGMQVPWDTIQAIAGTKAIDLWLLFPLGIAVNRLLRRDSKISEGVKESLNQVFGTDDWYKDFYETRSVRSLFGAEEKTERIVRVEEIGQYYVKRLETVFAGVAPNPLPLFNSRRTPLYLLCFAAANPKGRPIAVKIAQHILRS
ncbi:MAG: three-Cys-motif partner protein TcmP [Acidobacteriota bacterium]